MENSNNLQKVVDAVIAAISILGGTVPFKKSNGIVGEFTEADDKEAVREELMKYNTADNDKNICPVFAQQYYTHDIWTLFRGNDFIHLAI